MHNFFDLTFIFGAKYLYFFMYIIVFGWWLWQPKSGKREIFLFACFFFPLIILLANLAGHLYYNPRPFVLGDFKPLIYHSANNGFPSHHALLASAAAAVVSVFNWRLGLGLWMLACLVGISRVYVGVHHWLDIVASFLISISAALIIYYFKSYLQKRKNK